MILLRNIAFYIVFYVASVFCVTGSVIAAYIAPSGIRFFPDLWSKIHFWACRRLLGIRIVETGARPEYRAFYAIKHESFFEAINLPNMFDFPALFAKQELFDIPGWGVAARNYGVIPVARQEGAKALREMIRATKSMLEHDRPIIIFPEGTRVPHGEAPALQAGFAAIYKILNLPVVPVAIDSGPVYKRGLKLPKTITIHFGEPIEAGLPRPEIEARVHAGINALNTAAEAESAS